MTSQQLRIDSQRLKRDFDELIEIGATTSGGVTRLALSNDDVEARSWLANRIEDAGLLVRDDEVGNLSGVYPAQQAGAKTLLLGSHLDTVTNGGRYDGAIGVLAALECIRVIKEAGVQLPVHLEVINFTDEEGTWHSFFGSLGLIGALQPIHFDDVLQDNGAFRVALFRAGIRPDEVEQAKRDPESLAGFLELHIEQSDKLYNAQKSIGIVSRIVGRSVYQFDFYGEATHAATTPPDRRRDALQGAAIFITEMHQVIRDGYPEGVINCGNVTVEPGTFSVIPEKATLRIEMRHPDSDILAEIESKIIRLAHDCARDFSLSVSERAILRRPSATMSEPMRDVMEQICLEQNQSFMPIVSYAGHDAQILSQIAPAALIFVPSTDGISHNPKEHTAWNAIEAGANVMLQTILRWATV